ncbi:MAG: FKBP-type peptidyl-prolyl cis-trans isomerase [bacterium]|nr:FKBP-type peptidyl-prolyl cis-trans isomerase [bacterium]
MGNNTPAGTQAASAAGATDQVQGQDVKVGTGREAKPGDTVSVLYVGKFSDGTVFDSSAAHNNEPLKFTLGAGGLIAGFQIGVNGMKEGGQRVLSIPPSFGYGAQDVKDASGKVIIPANSTLIFEIQLEKVEDTPAAADTTTPKTQ